MTRRCRSRRALSSLSDSRMSNRVACSAGTSAEDEAGDHRQGQREQRHRPVHADALRARQAGHRGAGQQRHAPRRHQQAGERRRRTPAPGSRRRAGGRCAPRLAPSAMRTAISFCRPTARASSRLATFAQAISSTSATAPSSISSAGPDVLHQLILRARDQRADVAVGFGELRLELARDGVQLDARLLDRDAVVQPRDRKDARMPAAILGQRRRPRAERHVEIGGLEQLEAAPASRRRWCTARLSSSRRCPSGDAAGNRRSRKAALRIATPSAPAMSSAREKPRPCWIVTPSSGSSVAVIILAGTRSGSPPPVMRHAGRAERAHRR